MNVTKDSTSPTEVVLNVEMAPEDEEPFISRSYRRLVSRIQIPGFRPGKAPRSIVESHVGRSALVQEAIEFMVPETLDQVLKQENLQAFMEPDLEILEVEPVSFKAVVPLEPIVQLGDLASIKLDRQPAEVTDENVAEIIERFRYESAPWEPVDRPVQFGDLVTLDVKGRIDGEEAIDDAGVDYIPQVDNPLPVPGFSVYLEGMTEGQHKEFALVIAEDHHQTQYAGKECQIQIDVHSIKEKILPDLDDEFAKGVREGYESLDALKTHVSDQLTEAAENASLRRAEQDSLEELLKVSTIQASGLLYQREVDTMYEERERALRNQRLDMDTYLSYLGQTEEDWREELKPQAERRLNTSLLLRELAREQNIDVDPEEVQTEIDAMMTDSGDSEEAMRRVFSSDNARDSIRSTLLSRKVLRRLVDIIEGRSPEAASAPGAPPDSPDDEAPAGPEEDDASPVENAAITATSPALEVNEEGADPDAE